MVHLSDFDEGTKVLFETGSTKTRARLGIRRADTGVESESGSYGFDIGVDAFADRGEFVDE